MYQYINQTDSADILTTKYWGKKLKKNSHISKNVHKKYSQNIFQKNIFKINVFKLYSQITNQKIQILQFCSICKGEGAGWGGDIKHTLFFKSAD